MTDMSFIFVVYQIILVKLFGTLFFSIKYYISNDI